MQTEIRYSVRTAIMAIKLEATRKGDKLKDDPRMDLEENRKYANEENLEDKEEPFGRRLEPRKKDRHVKIKNLKSVIMRKEDKLKIN